MLGVEFDGLEGLAAPRGALLPHLEGPSFAPSSPDGERLVFYERGVGIRIGMVEGFKSAAPPERSAPASAGTARLRSGDTATACTDTS